MFKIYGGDTKFTQWTKNQKLIMSRLPLGAEVLFYNDPKEDEPLVTEVYEYTDENGISFHVCDVPNIFLTDTKRIKVRIPSKVVGLYGIVHSYVGQLERYFEVEPAEKPADYVYEETTTEGCEGQIQADLSQTDSAQVDYVKGVIRQESLPDEYVTETELMSKGYITETELTSKGYLTSYTETDPTVPAWAKSKTKPSYDFSELTVTDPEAAKTALSIENGMILKNLQAAMPSSASWYSVTYGNGKFVAVDDSNYSTKAAYSEDGITWTATTMPSTSQWISVTYGNGKFVAIADNSDIAAYSEDGINWTVSTLPISRYWRSVTYGNGKFVALASSSADTAFSYDGINWQTELKIISQNESDITESVRSVINKSIYETIVGVPACTTADNGKVLKVVDGVSTWVEA